MKRPFVLAALAAALTLATPAPAVAAQLNVWPAEVVAGDNGFCSLREAIVNANDDAATHADCPAGSGADQIVLPAATYLLVGGARGAETTLPVVTSEITIVGQLAKQHQVLDAAGAGRHLEVAPGGKLTLSKLTLVNGLVGAGADGGSILNAGTLATESSTLSGNEAGGHGGAIFTGGDATIAASTLIEGNRAGTGFVGDGGGVFVSESGKLTVMGSAVIENEADDGGGIASLGELDLDGATVIGNRADQDGGGVWNKGSAEMFGTSVSSNVARSRDGFGHGRGGGIANVLDGTVTALSSAVSLNEAAEVGGGIWNNGILFVGSSILVGNAADQGGGIANQGSSAIVSLSTLTDNLAQAADVVHAQGGGIHNRSRLTVAGSLLNSNDAGVGGGIYSDGFEVLVSNSTLSGNSAAGGGGVANVGTIRIVNSTLNGNSVGAFGAGGGLYNRDRATVEGSTLTGNTSGEAGGGVSNDEDGRLEIDQSTLSSNAAIYGGAIANGGELTLSNSTVNANSASAKGGGVANFEGVVAVTNSTLSGNSAATEGGGIHNAVGASGFEKLSLTNVTLAGNSAPAGAGIFFRNEGNTVKNTVVADSSGPNCSGVDFSADGSANLDDDGTCDDFVAGFAQVPSVLLGALQANGGSTQTHLPHPASPAVNTGDQAACNAVIPNEEQRGLARTAGPRCDIGAVELGSSEGITLLLTDLGRLPIHEGVKRSMERKLHAAQRAVGDGDVSAADDHLQAFGNEVRAQTGKKIAVEDGERLQAAAETLRELVTGAAIR